jgi:hypothetical protein
MPVVQSGLLARRRVAHLGAQCREVAQIVAPRGEHLGLLGQSRAVAPLGDQHAQRGEAEDRADDVGVCASVTAGEQQSRRDRTGQHRDDHECLLPA